MSDVKHALNTAEKHGLITIVEQYTGDFNVDQVFSSQHARAPRWSFPKQWGKRFVEARFLGRGAVPKRDPRTVTISLAPGLNTPRAGAEEEVALVRLRLCRPRSLSL